MKISFAVLATAAYANIARDADGNCPDDTWNYNGQCVESILTAHRQRSIAGSDGEKSTERRYEDLKNMALKLWAKNGFRGKNKFDERQYWAYGCHCFLLGDRPMSEMGQGKPVDALDNKCKAYKDCNKCVREKHGDECIGEFVKYGWKWSGKNNDLVSANAKGSCERELFECDRQFVYDTLDSKDVFNEEYHAFWSKTGFDNREEDNCPTGGTAPVDHQCCGGHDRNYHWIGLNKNKCCEDGQSGTVKPIDESC